MYPLHWLITNISLVVFLLRIYGQTLTLGQTPGDFVKNDAFARTVLIDTLLNSPRDIILYLTAVPQCLCLVSGLFFSPLPLFLVQCPTCQFTHSSPPRLTPWHDDVQISFDGITVPNCHPNRAVRAVHRNLDPFISSSSGNATYAYSPNQDQTKHRHPPISSTIFQPSIHPLISTASQQQLKPPRSQSSPPSWQTRTRPPPQPR